MTSAQAVFTEMVRHGIRPELRKAGFTGSGVSFELPSKTHHALIGLQKSRASRQTAVTFTANVSVGTRQAWDAARTEMAWLPDRPAANTRYGKMIWQSRIGLLMPEGRDRWWEVEADAAWEPVAEEVVAAILTYALPAMQRRMSA